MGGITVFSFFYYLIVVPDSLTKWSIINYTGAKASIEENKGGAHHATYGFRQYIDIVFPEDEVSFGSNLVSTPG